MNMIQKQEQMKIFCIEKLEESPKPYQGYPTEKFISADNNLVTIPEGGWDSEERAAIDQNITRKLIESRYIVDEIGRPVHPWFKEITNKVGMVAGRGAYWKWGPNKTVDPVVITTENQPKILLIKRTDNGNWAFPGGFIDDSDKNTTEAGRRECFEETTLQLADDPSSLIYEGIVTDPRSTAHAWAETSALLWRPPNSARPVQGNDDALEARWFPINNLPSQLHGSHSKIIEFALREI